MGFDYGPMATKRDGGLSATAVHRLARQRRAPVSQPRGPGSGRHAHPRRRADRVLHRRHALRGRLLGSCGRGLPESRSWRSATPTRSLALPWGSLIALVFTFVYLLLRRVVAFKECHEVPRPRASTAMLPAILILTFALTLKSMTSALGAAEFVSGCMEGAAEGPVQHASRHHLPGGVRTRVRHGHQLGHVRHPHPHRAAHLRQQPRASHHRHLRLPGGRGVPATIARPFPTRPSWRRPART